MNKVIIRANHPVLKRVDKPVDESKVGAEIMKLVGKGYEIESVESPGQKHTVYKSAHPRRADDHYPTIDLRCVQGLTRSIMLTEPIVDCCAPNGSGIIDGLKSLGYDNSFGVPDALVGKLASPARWVVYNPPYKRDIVDKIISRQIERVKSREIDGAAALLRSTFDHAGNRNEMFRDCPYYFGQIKLCFRPIWIEPNPDEKKTSPFWNYVWHVWTRLPSERVILHDEGTAAHVLYYHHDGA